MSHLTRLQERLRAMQCDAFLIPSTDEYLSEFTQPFTRRLEWVTGFHGSTGMAVVLKERAAIFLDGRYKTQGVRDTEGLKIEVLGAGEAAVRQWLDEHLQPGQVLALDTRLQPYPDVQGLREFALRRGFKLLDFEVNPIDELWGAKRPAAPDSQIVDYPLRYAGLSAGEKCAQLRQRMEERGEDLHIVADPEDVAWLLNVRTHDSRNTQPNGWHVLPIPLGRALIELKGGVFWFIEESRLEPALAARLRGMVTVLEPSRFEPFLREQARGKTVGANLARTPHRFAMIAVESGTLQDDPVIAHRRWVKHANEIAGAREGHFLDGQAVIRFLAWLQRTVPERTVTERDAARQLTEFRAELPGYEGLSMPLMSASGSSGAMAHYVPTEQSNRRLNDHPIYWMDSGGQYFGCSTDNTVCMAVGEPEARHVRCHTLVVKGLIALSRVRFPVGTHSNQLDGFARHALWQEGLDYAHGTGHGVGSFMNIHEGPAIQKVPSGYRVVPMQAGMIVSNEPAYYAEGDFGIRVETHMVAVPSKYDGFLEFETLSRLPIDPRLIEPSLLTAPERRWLADYHAHIHEGYRDRLDLATADWLRDVARFYADQAARSPHASADCGIGHLAYPH